MTRFKFFTYLMPLAIAGGLALGLSAAPAMAEEEAPPERGPDEIGTQCITDASADKHLHAAELSFIRAICDSDAEARGYQAGFVRPAPPNFEGYGCSDPNDTPHVCFGVPGTGFGGTR